MIFYPKFEGHVLQKALPSEGKSIISFSLDQVSFIDKKLKDSKLPAGPSRHQISVRNSSTKLHVNIYTYNLKITRSDNKCIVYSNMLFNFPSFSFLDKRITLHNVK